MLWLPSLARTPWSRKLSITLSGVGRRCVPPWWEPTPQEGPAKWPCPLGAAHKLW